jgi:hypothetical protein
MKKHILHALRSSGIFLTSMALPAAAIYAVWWAALHAVPAASIGLAMAFCTLILTGLYDLTK